MRPCYQPHAVEDVTHMALVTKRWSCISDKLYPINREGRNVHKEYIKNICGVQNTWWFMWSQSSWSSKGCKHVYLVNSYNLFFTIAVRRKISTLYWNLRLRTDWLRWPGPFPRASNSGASPHRGMLCSSFYLHQPVLFSMRRIVFHLSGRPIGTTGDTARRMIF